MPAQAAIKKIALLIKNETCMKRQPSGRGGLNTSVLKTREVLKASLWRDVAADDRFVHSWFYFSASSQPLYRYFTARSAHPENPAGMTAAAAVFVVCARLI